MRARSVTYPKGAMVCETPGKYQFPCSSARGRRRFFILIFFPRFKIRKRKKQKTTVHTRGKKILATVFLVSRRQLLQCVVCSAGRQVRRVSRTVSVEGTRLTVAFSRQIFILPVAEFQKKKIIINVVFFFFFCFFRHCYWRASVKRGTQRERRNKKIKSPPHTTHTRIDVSTGGRVVFG